MYHLLCTWYTMALFQGATRFELILLACFSLPKDSRITIMLYTHIYLLNIIIFINSYKQYMKYIRPNIIAPIKTRGIDIIKIISSPITYNKSLILISSFLTFYFCYHLLTDNLKKVHLILPLHIYDLQTHSLAVV